MSTDIQFEFSNGLELCDRGLLTDLTGPAMCYFDAVISRGRALDDARALAMALQVECGVKSGDRVAVMMQNIPQMPIAIHAIWMLGAIVTPVNVMNKPRELRHQMKDSGAIAIICSESYYESINTIVDETDLMHVVTVNELDYLDDVPAALSEIRRPERSLGIRYVDLIAKYRDQRPAVLEIDPSQPALVSYTSGTTGLPKGAINTHGAVAHNAKVWRDWYGLHSDDVVVAAAPLFHITGFMGSFAASRAAGAPLLLTYRFEPGEMLRLIEQWRGTWMVASLTAFIAMLEHPSLSSRDLSSLTKVASGGAPVSAAVADRFENTTGIYLHNAYGLTETTSTAVLVPFGDRAPVDDEDGALSVGVPVPGAEIRIVSTEDGEEVPAGEPGELLIKGPMVTPFYWNNPSATEAAFKDGWFSTGDVAKSDGAGWYWIVDRVKDMIISSGFKVWPREVEDVIFSHPAVSETSVVGVVDEYRGESVVAFVILRRGHEETTEAQLIDHCRELLAAYKVPRAVHFVAELPKTATGKVLRRELRIQATANADATSSGNS